MSSGHRYFEKQLLGVRKSVQNKVDTLFSVTDHLPAATFKSLRVDFGGIRRQSVFALENLSQF